MRRPPRLQKRGHRFYCRAAVPRELRPIIGKAEIIRPLKTGDYEEAVQRLPLASAQVNAELAAARRRLSAVPTTTLSDHDARQIVLRWFWREERQQVDAEAASDQETWLGREEAIAENQLDLTALKDPDDPVAGSSVQQRVERLLDEYNLRLEQNGSEISKLRDLVRRAMIERTRRGIDQLRGDFPKPRDPLFADVISEGAAPERPKRSEVTLRQLVDMYLEDPTRQAGAKADYDYQVMLRLIGEFISPDSPLGNLTRDHCRKVAGLLRKLPANAAKKKQFRGLTPLQAVRRAERLGVPPMSATTANSYITKMSAIFRWAVREGLVERDPAEGLMLPEGTHKRDARLPFSSDQLSAILSSDLYQEPKEQWDHHQWIFLVSLCSGLRLNEACTLGCDDIQMQDGVSMILVRPDEEGRKRLKSRAARRMVPVHPTLKKLGFLGFVETQRAAGHKVLFPKLKPDRRGYYSDGYQK